MYCISRPLTREDEVIIGRSARASIEPQSLLKAESDLTPSCSATDSGSVEGKLGKCVVAVGDGCSWREPELVTWLECELASSPYYAALGQHMNKSAASSQSHSTPLPNETAHCMPCRMCSERCAHFL